MLQLFIWALNLSIVLSVKSSTAVTSFHYQHGMGRIGMPTVLPFLPLQSHCVKHQNFHPAVIITDVLKRQTLSPTWTATDVESLKFFIFWPLLNCRPVAIVTTMLEMGSVSSQTHLFIYLWFLFWLTGCCNCAAYNLRVDLIWRHIF